ncbi:MAG: threonylcarbamoyl-AMP synthase [Candidatus Aminicenantes bacterium]|nr:threonylcarbamoyl-AMP synthase [Candidatus Aminicenantes bacterium]
MKTLTEFMKIDLNEFDLPTARKIRDILDQNGVIIYPTDTIYGLGGNCFSLKVIKRIFKIKNRSRFKALAVVVSDLDMLNEIVRETPDSFEDLSKKFWPGALTLILKAATHLPSDLLGPGGTIAVRQPGLDWLRRLIAYCGFPLISTSSNVSGKENIFNAEQAFGRFRGKVELVIDGGKVPTALPSTIVDLTSPEPKIIRKGAVPAEKIIPYLQK